MARGHGRILASVWEDSDFLDLDEREQRLYLFLISQPNLNHAGLLDLTLRRWARKARGLTVAELEKRIDRLEETHFVVVDDDTEELLIRSFIRNDGVWRMPKVMGAAVSGALEISSSKLQRALLDEMDRIPLDELNADPTKLRNGTEGPSIRQQVADHISTLRKAFGTPTPDPSEGGNGAPSVTPSGTPSDTPSQDPVEGGPKASTRGRARTSRAHSPAPAPTPTPVPSPVEEGSAEADGQAELVVVQESDFVGAAEAAPEESKSVGANVIVAEWLERVNKRPPSNVIGQTSKQIKKLLDEGIDADDIRAGLSLWLRKGSAPSAIPSFVNQAMNAQPQRLAAAAGAENVLDFPAGRQSTADRRAGAAFDLAAELAAEENQ
ncbi:hypothetical protein KVH30_02000 [Streptomyces olivaceus]|uniref:hypothetical protein n=1 Tax=Streptomyces olivaceus TaxID=47716 RepID=UPI001CCAD443|nr:hypothetical protein [Streptomyces olivaceus]MBZ6290344.1 hypothetical protein [Streptomyces olivaceus]MBZ6324296.1 hypothetical protein [Streptomyces olivaceus]